MSRRLLAPNRPLLPVQQRDDLLLPTRTLSVSQLRSHSQCPFCWSRRYVEGERPVTSLSFAVGSGVHAALEMARRARMEGRGDPDPEDMEEAARDEFEGTILGRWRDGTVPEIPPVLRLTEPELRDGEAKARGRALDTTVRIVQTAVPAVLEAESGYRVLEVEVGIDYSGVFPFPFSGYPDVLLQDPDDWGSFGLLKDAKTAQYAALPDEWAAIQLCVYRLPWWLAGEHIDLGVDQFLKQTPPDPERAKTPQKRQEAEEWRSYRLWTDPGYSLVPTDAEMRCAFDRVTQAADRLSEDFRRGSFMPIPHAFGEGDYPHPGARFHIDLGLGELEVAG